jgi:hypothetical protein
MDRAPLPKWLKIVIAIAACAIVMIGYSFLSVALGFEHGGGYVLLILLFSLLGGLWRAIVGSGKDKDEDKIDEADVIRPETLTEREPVFELTPNPVPNAVPEQSDQVVVEAQPPIAKTIDSSIKPDYHLVLMVLLIIFMAVGIVVMIYQAINDFTWENYTVGWIRLVGGLVGLGGFVLLYLKKISGYIIIVSVLLFGIVYSAIMHDSNLGMVIFAALFRLVAISLFLLIRKEGISAWSILLHKHTELLSEIKETFPVKPFVYIDKIPEGKTSESNQTSNSFDNWLKN